MALQKGKFYNADTNSEVVTCQFNPDEIGVSRSNQWNYTARAGTNVVEAQFASTQPQTLKLKLVFDSYEAKTDVRASTDLVQNLMNLSSTSDNTSRPPHVKFGWGQFMSFRAVITDFNQRFTLFLDTGVPVRATVDVTLKEVIQVTGGQNPTSRAAGARRMRTVQPGDTMDLLSHQELGDPTKWRRLAEANGIEDPRRLKPGMILFIPPEV